MPEVRIIPHYENERLFEQVVARCNEVQADFRFRVERPDLALESPLSRPVADYKEILPYLDQKKKNFGMQAQDLIIALFDGRLTATDMHLTNLFMAGAHIEEEFACTAAISLRFISWGILERKFDYELQRHALQHLMVCGLLGAYTKVGAHMETFGCLLDFNSDLTGFNRKLQRGYYLCSEGEKGCHRAVSAERFGGSIIQLCSGLKYELAAKTTHMHIESLMLDNSNRSVSGVFENGANIVTGDSNVVSTNTIRQPLPAPDTVDVVGELAALRKIIEELSMPDRGKCQRALDDATDETAKPSPDKEEVAGAIERVVKYAKAADDFGEHAATMLPRVIALGSWLGAHGRPLLSMLGIQV